ncbi:MAG: amino acid adenylation domain-containing protein [Clostridium cadaveris]|nr:amino acid adenylation domain-containing protein [Clostridium cadaveris]MDU4953015.1 amino acid adenylation domain-containing protein [Clostridium sp.]MDY4950455.1 amino acid adenylation domain-containing protein [Clostridium cadaveris]NWK12103.1 amino acid adenylation domain-containing protein [Clostridium cadaveris]UFH65045.1 amino acid adenylation domain-containing protein [Clostridium cadaveris]
MKNVLEYLEESAKKYPNKIAVKDPENSCSYINLLQNAKHIGSGVLQYEVPRSPVIVFMNKSVEALSAFMGIVHAGCFYIFINPDQTDTRIKQILEITKAKCIITHSEFISAIKKVEFSGHILEYSKLVKTEIEDEKLKNIREMFLDIDPLYCNFTSGSTGVPKGVLVSHRNVIDFMEYFPDMFQITQDDIIGNQAPFDFDVSVKDIYSTLKVGATMVIIPKHYFSIVTLLLDYICNEKVTTMIWAVSALCLITQFKGLTYRIPESVNKILFSGEVMPIKHLKLWQKALPQANFVNLYGPTEITCNCTYYRIDREFEDNEILPIGRAFPNEKVFLLDENDKEIIDKNKIGEICVSGTAVALGYYNNHLQTNKAFVQNPLNSQYMETIYRTGDLASYNEHGDLCFAGRKDFQIKYMGHRIELEEIEATLNGYEDIQRACCVFDSDKNKIIAFYVGNMERKEIHKKMRETLPVYMIPKEFHLMDELPITQNGKIDRKKLKNSGGSK